MNEFKMSDYGIFTNAVSTANTLNSKFEIGQTAVNDCQSKLSNESIFMGPACDSCIEGLTQTTSKITTLKSNFDTIGKYLIETSSNYQAGDDAALKALSFADGSVAAQTLQAYRGNGQTIYYNQNGYYDNTGNFHRWQSNWGKDIASSGCGPTSMAAILANMLHDPTINPTTIANTMKYNDNVGGRYVINSCAQYGLDQDYHIHANQQEATTFLQNGGMMICAVNEGGHYIAVLGYDQATGNYIVCDPNDSHTAERAWTYRDITVGRTMCFYIAPPGKTVEQTFAGGGTAVRV